MPSWMAQEGKHWFTRLVPPVLLLTIPPDDYIGQMSRVIRLKRPLWMEKIVVLSSGLRRVWSLRNKYEPWCAYVFSSFLPASLLCSCKIDFATASQLQARLRVKAGKASVAAARRMRKRWRRTGNKIRRMSAYGIVVSIV